MKNNMKKSNRKVLKALTAAFYILASIGIAYGIYMEPHYEKPSHINLTEEINNGKKLDKKVFYVIYREKLDEQTLHFLPEEAILVRKETFNYSDKLIEEYYSLKNNERIATYNYIKNNSGRISGYSLSDNNGAFIKKVIPLSDVIPEEELNDSYGKEDFDDLLNQLNEVLNDKGMSK
ncbi:MAG TPA: hypothetical protein PLC53_01680 [Bacilli bacterium]|nr:hypothetical protein [Bacilli bacterium]